MALDSAGSMELRYLLSCDVALDVAVKVRCLDLGLGGGAWSARDAELFVSAQVFSGGHETHVVAQCTHYCELAEDRRRAFWGEWVVLPVKYTELQLNARVVLSVWSAAKGRLGVAVANLFDASARLRRGRVQLAVCKDLDVRMAVNESREADGMAQQVEPEEEEKNRIWSLGEKYNHDEMQRLPWLDELARARTQEITSSISSQRSRKVCEEEENMLTLTVEFPYFEYPIVFEERAYYSETMDAIFSLRSQEEQIERAKVRSRFVRNSRSGMESNPGSPRPFPWENQLCVVYDPELMHTQGRMLDAKETLDPVEEKYRKLNPSMVRGVVDRSLKPNKDEREHIQQIIQSSGRLNRKNQDLLWKFCYSLVNDKKALVKFVMSVDWDNPAEVRQAEQLLQEWAPIDIADALRLLGDETEFRNVVVRAHAIKILDQASDAELLLYLLQLVQALRYDDDPQDEDPIFRESTVAAPVDEVEEIDPARVRPPPPPVSSGNVDTNLNITQDDSWRPGLLAKFLIRRAVKSESLVSFLTWYLSTEVEHKESGLLFGNVHRELLQQLRVSPGGRLLAAQLSEQSNFVKKIMNMGKEGRGRAVTRQNYLQRMLKQPDGKYHELCNLHTPVMHPLSPWKRVVAVDPDSLKVFNSKTQPIKLDLIISATESATPNSPPERAPGFFKVGDDVRQDQLVLQLLGVMDKMFKDVNLDLKLTLYRVLAFSNDEGVMEFVSGSYSLSQIQRNFGTISNFFHKQAKEKSTEEAERKKHLSRQDHSQDGEAAGSSSQSSWTKSQQNVRVRTEKEIYDELVNNFIKSCAGYCMCTYILCVGDRHLDNLMIKSADGALFHIDFGFILGHDPRSWAVGPIRLTRDMIDTMGGRGSPGFEKFISYCCQAYRILRRNSDLILNLLYLMKDSKIENLFDDHEAVIKIVRDRFELNLSDENAEIWLLDKLNKCEDTFITTISDTLHNANVFFN